MFGLTTYRGVIRDGKIELKDASLPDGTEVVVVAQQSVLSVEEQIKHLEALSAKEWEKPFRDYFAFAAAYPSELDINELGDDELVNLVNETRREAK